jgi:hypothetical protein
MVAKRMGEESLVDCSCPRKDSKLYLYLFFFLREAVLNVQFSDGFPSLKRLFGTNHCSLKKGSSKAGFFLKFVLFFEFEVATFFLEARPHPLSQHLGVCALVSLVCINPF